MPDYKDALTAYTEFQEHHQTGYYHDHPNELLQLSAIRYLKDHADQPPETADPNAAYLLSRAYRLLYQEALLNNPNSAWAYDLYDAWLKWHLKAISLGQLDALYNELIYLEQRRDHHRLTDEKEINRQIGIIHKMIDELENAY